MIASALRYTIQIYTVSFTEDSTGDPVQTESLLKSKSAGVKYTGGNESTEADQRTASTKVRFQIRYDTIITPTMRVAYDGEKYDINYIEKINRDTMYLHCSQITKQ